MRRIEAILITGFVVWVSFSGTILLAALTSPRYHTITYTVHKVAVLEDGEYYRSLLNDIGDANRSIYI